MILQTTPTHIQLIGYESKLSELKQILTYHDNKKLFELQRFKKNRWLLRGMSDEDVHARIDELKSQQFVCLLEQTPKGLFTLAGLRDLIANHFQDFEFKPFTRPKYSSVGLAYEVPLPFELRPYQLDAVEKLKAAGHGAVSLPTGSGKSLVALELVKQTGLQTTVSAPSVSIANQLLDTFTESLGAKNVGKYGDGKKQLGKLVTIGVAQSLAKIETGSPAWNHFKNTKVIISDECFPYDSGVFTKDGVRAIGAVANGFQKGKRVEVLSYNESSQRFEYQPVISSKKTVRTDLIKISFTCSSITCTPEHPFLTNVGWKCANELAVYDVVLGYDMDKTREKTKNSGGPSLSSDQWQIILGSYIGDGGISKHANKYRLRVIHGMEQEAYLNWMAGMLDSPIEFLEKNGFSQKPAVRFTTKTFVSPFDFYRRKKLNKKIVDALDWRGVAIWYMDDGTCDLPRSKSGTMCTHGFDVNEVELLINKLQSMGVKCHMGFEKKGDGRSWPVIELPKEGFVVLSKNVAPYIHPNLSYKIIDPLPDDLRYVWNKSQNKTHEFLVTKIGPASPPDGSRRLSQGFVYDIGVNQNHNFVVTGDRKPGMTSGVIAHNCHTLPALTFQKMALELFSDVPYRFFFSATQFRNDGTDLLLDGIIGPIVLDLSVQDLVDQHYLAKPHFMLVKAASGSTYESSDAQRMINRHLYQNPDLHRKAAGLANYLAKEQGFQVLVMIDHIEQFKYLEPYFALKPEFAHGGVTEANKKFVHSSYHKSDTSDLVNRFNKKEFKILVGTGAVSTGTDFKTVNAIINLQGGKSAVKFTQLVGRGTRLAPNKEDFFFIDFNIQNVSMLNNHFKARVKVYKSIYNNIKELNF
jgi:superfamily II DNA or RNA helicase